MTKRFLLEFEGGYYNLFTVHNYDNNGASLIKSKSYQVIVLYCKDTLVKEHENFEVVDIDTEGTAYFENGNLRVDSNMGMNDKFMILQWKNGGVKSYDSDDYEPDCSACGDGGCFHCEPHRFI